MGTVLTVLHVVTAVFVVGPMAVLPMTALRAVRAGNAPVVGLLARSTWVFSLASLVVAVLGFGVVGTADQRFGLSVGTPWVLTSIVLYLVALAVSLFLVVPGMRQAAADLAASGASKAYGRIAAASGVVSLLLLAVTVLMVWKP